VVIKRVNCCLCNKKRVVFVIQQYNEETETLPFT